ncbi:hypothetical protein [Haloquadratum walsbyi]|jgi:hypothetical protein|uniref:HTH domain protein n=1 Tax=Haloquadratum walsbyi (strain DSM 16854 / JCM 12705 / C23) TaxID=768065 RepID=G0LN78_HALWC|nr:hypothetical protein [Haloquadratum walsbyi]CCC41884.1 uncharacterized protein Hqrw_5008 [Haloquadratum walsbyi C23]
MGSPGRKPTVADEDILAVFRQASDPVLTTQEVSNELEIGHRGTFDRLKKLVEMDDLSMKKVGDTGAVWWYPAALRNKYQS